MNQSVHSTIRPAFSKMTGSFREIRAGRTPVAPQARAEDLTWRLDQETYRYDLTVLTQVRFVITLDTDTQLPRDAARDLLAVIDGLQPEDSGGFWAYDGQRLRW